MNTVEKGDKFEDLCYELISEALENYELGYIPSYCRVYQKKGYYSTVREKDIIFDISIEVWSPGADRYIHLMLIECKDYSPNDDVPVGDITKFEGYAEQVAGLNIKGVLMSRTSFQSGCYTTAKNRGIMLIEVNDNLALNIILHKTEKHRDIQLEKEYIINKDLYLEDNLVKTIIHRRWNRKLSEIILQCFIDRFSDIKAEEETLIPKLSADRIEEITEQILRDFNDDLIFNGEVINWDEFIEYLETVFELSITFNEDLGCDSNDSPILSCCSFSTKSIKISREITNTKRQTFALAHELGHFFLHDKLILSQNKYEEFDDIQENFKSGRKKLITERDWIEWQANQFASSLILPKKSLIYQLAHEKVSLGQTTAKLYVDDQPDNLRDFHNITANLAAKFNTSKTTIIYRLEYFDLITYNFSSKSVGEIMKKIMR